MSPVVLVTDHPAPTTVIEAKLLAAIGGELLVAVSGDEAELVALAHDADAILTCFRNVTPAVVRAGARLRVIGRYGVGVDNIAVSTATELGIPVTNVPDYCTDEVAEHAIGLLLALGRGIRRYDAAIRTGDWAITSAMPLHRLTGSTLGIVGFGRVGRAVARRAAGLGLRLLIASPSTTQADADPFGAEVTDLDDLLARSDAVTIHAPLTSQTRHLMDARRLALLRPSAILVNCARGGLIDPDALADALSSGRLAGAGLDVYEPERLPVDHPLLRLDNAVLTPHVAFYSEESMAELQRRATQNVIEVLSGREPEDVVNGVAVTPTAQA